MSSLSAQALIRQTVLAELGLRVISADSIGTLAGYVAHAVADAIGAAVVGVFEWEREALVLRAGAGWPDELYGRAVLGVADQHIETVLGTSEPVSIHDEVPEALAAVGIASGLTVRLGGAGEPAGALGAYAFEDRVLDDGVATFMGAVAALLAGGIERVHMEQALRESEARALAVLRTTVDGVITIDERGQIESFNLAAERIFGYTAAEVVGQNVHILMPDPYHAEHDGYIQAYHETGRRKIIGIGREVVGRRKDGSTFPLDLAVSEVRLANRTIFTGFVRDISERRTLEHEVLRVAEDERRRIGHDLHDGLGQMLTGTALIARGLARKIERNEVPEVEEAEEVVHLIKEADAHARRLARGLAPVELNQGGLAAALERLAANAEPLFGIRCTVEVLGEGTASLPDAVPMHLFRIAQEALSNAVRHGQAERVAITLAHGSDRLRLRVQDDGRGFPDVLRTGGAETLATHLDAGEDLSAPTSGRPEDNRGMGIRIMHYRARVIGGRLEIRPGTERGTVVTCTLPLSHRASDDLETSRL